MPIYDEPGPAQVRRKPSESEGGDGGRILYEKYLGTEWDLGQTEVDRGDLMDDLDRCSENPRQGRNQGG